jgi:hypothetical protein
MSGSLPPRSPDGPVRGPALVQLPRARAPKGAELVRLRLPDRPGSLAAIAGHFAAHGVDVLRLEVLGRSSGLAIDDFLVAGPALDDAIAGLGSHASLLARRPGIDLRDPGLAMAAACAAVTGAGSGREAHRSLVQAALELVFAEAGLLCVRQDNGSLRIAASTEPDVPLLLDGSAASLLASALYSGEPLTADGRAPWAPPGYRDLLPAGAVAAVPGGSPASLVLVLLRTDPAPFVAAELDRLAALVRVAVGTLQLHDARPAANGRGVPAGVAF